MILGCIDIGSNTTRLLVADAEAGALRELLAERVFTQIGRSTAADGRIPAEKVEETATVVRAQVRAARALGAAEIVGVATAAVREAPNRDDLARAVETELDGPLHMLSGEEEARLSFVGATRTLADRPAGTIAVVDVGGGSTELAIGPAEGAVEWSRSFPVGSGLLADTHLRSDPPAPAELEAARTQVSNALAGPPRPPEADGAVAVGGTATSLHRLLGPELTPDALRRGVDVMASAPASDLAERFELDVRRVRLLPAGILVLAAVSDLLALPMRIARGGLREGVLLERAEA